MHSAGNIDDQEILSYILSYIRGHNRQISLRRGLKLSVRGELNGGGMDAFCNKLIKSEVELGDGQEIGRVEGVKE